MPRPITAPSIDLATDRVNLNSIAEQWDDLLRLAGSLKLGVVQASAADADAADQRTPDPAGPRARGTRPHRQDALPAQLLR